MLNLGLPGCPAHLRAGAGQSAPADGERRHPGGGKAPLCAVPGQQSCINPNTIQRAYESPGGGGLCLFYPLGKGSFAAPRTGVDEERRDRLLGQFDSLTAELLYLGVTRDRLIARIREKGGEVQ